MSHHTNWLYTLDSEGFPCELINGQRLIAAMKQQGSCGGGGALFTQLKEDCQWHNGTFPFALDPCSVDTNGNQTWLPMTFAGTTWPGNPAPWWDGVNGSPSSLAYGIWIEEWTGLDGAHHKRNVAPRAGRRGGANVGALFSGNRVWKMNLIFVGGSAAALEDLFRWFENTVLDCCDPCSGQEALIRTTCPPDGDPSFGVYNVKGFSMIEGPAWEAPPIEALGCYLRRVSVTFGVSDPCLYSCSTNCATDEPYPFVGGPCIPFDLWWGCNRGCSDLAAYRICCPVPAAVRGSVSPVVTITNNSANDGAPVRIFGMIDAQNVGCDPCTLPVCQDIITKAIPGGATLLVDSATRKVLYKDGSTGDQYVDGTAFLDPPAGTVPSFLSLSCDPGWVSIEPASFCGATDGLVFTIDIVERVGCC